MNLIADTGPRKPESIEQQAAIVIRARGTSTRIDVKFEPELDKTVPAHLQSVVFHAAVAAIDAAKREIESRLGVKLT